MKITVDNVIERMESCILALPEIGEVDKLRFVVSESTLDTFNSAIELQGLSISNKPSLCGISIVTDEKMGDSTIKLERKRSA